MLPQKSSLPLDSSHHFGYAIQRSVCLQSVNTTALQMASPPRLPGAPTRWACERGAFSRLLFMHGYAAVGVRLALRIGAVASLCAPSAAVRWHHLLMCVRRRICVCGVSTPQGIDCAAAAGGITCLFEFAALRRGIDCDNPLSRDTQGEGGL